MNDLEQLLAETAEAPPCGPNLEYDPAFLELEEFARGKPEQQIGANVIPAQEPAWSEVRERAARLLLRTKDLRVAILLARASLRSEGVAALDAALGLVAGLLERYWDQLHPGLDREDNDDPTMRLNALAQLDDAAGFVRDLRECVFVVPRGMRPVTVRDVEIALGRLPPREAGGVPSVEQLDAMLREAAAAGTVPLAAIAAAAQRLQALRRFLAEKVGTERAPEFEGLAEVIGALQQACRSVAPPEPVAAAAAAGGPQGAAAAPAMPGEIRSRQDAIMLLERVCEYLERNEPTNPAPLFIRRAKKLMTKNFVDILRELAPDSVSNVERMTGIGRE